MSEQHIASALTTDMQCSHRYYILGCTRHMSHACIFIIQSYARVTLVHTLVSPCMHVGITLVNTDGLNSLKPVVKLNSILKYRSYAWTSILGVEVPAYMN